MLSEVLNDLEIIKVLGVTDSTDIWIGTFFLLPSLLPKPGGKGTRGGGWFLLCSINSFLTMALTSPWSGAPRTGCINTFLVPMCSWSQRVFQLDLFMFCTNS